MPRSDAHDPDRHPAAGGHREHAAGHTHVHRRDRNQRRLALVLALVLGYAGVELIGGVLTGSLALLSDALHMVSDSAALALSLLAGFLAARPAKKRRTFGNSRVEILAALANGVALAVVALFISVNAFERYFTPREVAGEGLFAVAAGGLVVNLIALLLLEGGRGDSLNLRGAFLHVVSNTLASVGVCLAGVGIWTIGSGEISLSSHLVVAPGPGTEALLERVRARLSERFSIDHTTIQIELDGPAQGGAGACLEACEPMGQPA